MEVRCGGGKDEVYVGMSQGVRMMVRWGLRGCIG